MSRYPDDDYRRSEPRHSRREPPPRERDPRDRIEPTRDRRIMDDRMDRDIRMSDPMDTRMDTRLDSRMDSRMDPRMDSRMDIPRLDNRMDARTDPRANTASRIDPRPDRALDSRSAEPDGGGRLIRDPNTGELYREVRPVTTRSPFTVDDRDYDSIASRRTTVDTPMSRERESLRPEYTEYFCPGVGIDREVIQHEICKYLGQDATCRPGRSSEVCHHQSLAMVGVMD